MVPDLEYQVNRDFIAKNLCVNAPGPPAAATVNVTFNKKMATDESQQQAPGKGGQKEESP